MTHVYYCTILFSIEMHSFFVVVFVSNTTYNEIHPQSLITDARRVKMIRVKHPGPYEDLLGPALLGIALMTAIVAQFSLKLYSVWYY